MCHAHSPNLYGKIEVLFLHPKSGKLSTVSLRHFIGTQCVVMFRYADILGLWYGNRALVSVRCSAGPFKCHTDDLELAVSTENLCSDQKHMVWYGRTPHPVLGV